MITKSGAKSWNEYFESKKLGGDEFSIITIATVWSFYPNVTRYMINAIELHNHVCPGLISGYFVSRSFRFYSWKKIDGSYVCFTK